MYVCIHTVKGRVWPHNLIIQNNALLIKKIISLFLLHTVPVFGGENYREDLEMQTFGVYY